MENPIKMDDLGVPLFLEIPICHLQCQHLVIYITCPASLARFLHEVDVLLSERWLDVLKKSFSPTVNNSGMFLFQLVFRFFS